nr:bifunctional RNase H/acid phosphatase [Motilibacter aurantiacus]
MRGVPPHPGPHCRVRAVTDASSQAGQRRLVVEADGGSRGNPGPAGYGSLVKDAATGEVLAERAGGLGHTTNNVAEYTGLVEGLRAAAEIDPSASVEVRMDSKLVVEQMSGRWKIKHPPLQPLALAARQAFDQSRVRYTWIPRAQNSHADRLGNEAMDAQARGEQWTPTVGVRGGGALPVAIDEAEPEPAVPANKLTGWDDVGTPTTFVLVRHGESANTLRKLFCGRGGADPGLTERGRAQAEAAARALPGFCGPDRPVAVVSSPLRRARETAEAAAALVGVPVKVEEGFAEASFGEWDGLDLAAVREQWPAQLQAWLDSPAAAPPGGESLDEVGARVKRARDKVIARYAGRTVVVVSHVTPLKQLVRLALDAPAHSLFRMEMTPASLHLVQWWPDGGASLRAFNSTSHLSGLLGEPGL